MECSHCSYITRLHRRDCGSTNCEEAEAKVDPCGYGDRDDGWQVDENPELFINDDYTERMDKLFPDDYADPDD